eukprot:TRINITY_DN1904_c0_g2_i1.p1 TRINITY_DN1904_c0_g2~~TRINITY_DN1904_c0_g2_i1.p1  ORF type:complete len:590 (+),score=96.25 TRINITY_DN1904_c0_g2_i1:483-2252(+)
MVMVTILLVLLIIGLAFANPAVQTQFGLIVGGSDVNCRYFKGIPYAQAPVGVLRWHSPISWTQNFSSTGLIAQSFGAACMQPFTSLNSFHVSSVLSEDCLFLNVFTPLSAPSNLPVLVFVHGGGYLVGSAAQSQYNASLLANSQSCVVVTLNYRLGVLGFLATTALQSAGDATGNYGVQDVMEAFRWVRNNIASFGGNPASITAMGEDAGGGMLSSLLTTSAANGLFDRVIIQSGAAETVSLAAAVTTGQVLITALSCDNVTSTVAQLQCLRNVPATNLISALPSSPFMLSAGQMLWLPVVDGVIFVANPWLQLEYSRFTRLPLMLGFDTNDMSLFVYAYYSQPLNAMGYVSAVQNIPLLQNNSALIAQVLERYPTTGGDADNRPALVALLTDAYVTCPMRQLAEVVVAEQDEVYLFRFARETVCSPYGSQYGVPRTAEVPYVFQQPYPSCVFSVEELQLSNTVMQFWVSFASSGTPSASGTTVWPMYSSTLAHSIVLDIPIFLQQQPFEAQCRFWSPLLFPTTKLPGWVVPVAVSAAIVIVVVIGIFVVAQIRYRLSQRKQKTVLDAPLLSRRSESYSGWQLRPVSRS